VNTAYAVTLQKSKIWICFTVWRAARSRMLSWCRHTPQHDKPRRFLQIGGLSWFRIISLHVSLLMKLSGHLGITNFTQRFPAISSITLIYRYLKSNWNEAGLIKKYIYLYKASLTKGTFTSTFTFTAVWFLLIGNGVLKVDVGLLICLLANCSNQVVFCTNSTFRYAQYNCLNASKIALESTVNLSFNL
jgi:hypothetical protein